MKAKKVLALSLAIAMAFSTQNMAFATEKSDVVKAEKQETFDNSEVAETSDVLGNDSDADKENRVASNEDTVIEKTGETEETDIDETDETATAEDEITDVTAIVDENTEANSEIDATDCGVTAEETVTADEVAKDEELTGGTDIGSYLEIDSNGIITKYNGSGIADIIIPDTVNSKTVKGIGNAVFQKHTELTSVQFPSSLTSIGQYAFAEDSALQTADISNTNITQIGNSAFWRCSVLHDVVLPETLTEIGQSAFSEVAMGTKAATQKLIIPKSVTYIGQYAFANCEYLGEVEFSDVQTPSLDGINWGLDSGIHSLVFYNCHKLKKIRLSNNIVQIPTEFAKSCYELNTVEWDNNIKSIGDYAFEANVALQTADLSNTKITTIGEGAFINCSELHDVVFPSTLTKIGESAFNKAALGKKSATQKLIIPKSVTEIGESAFEKCEYLGEVEFEDVQEPSADGITWGLNSSSGDSYCFNECPRLTKIKMSNNFVTVPSGFAKNCPLLSQIVFGPNVKYIKARAFLGSALGDGTKLGEITISSKIKEIGHFAFAECTLLGKVVIEDDSQEITFGNGAFQDNKYLTYLDIPKRVYEIPEDNFRCVDNIRYMVVRNGNCDIKAELRSGHTMSEKLTVYCDSGSKVEKYAKTQDGVKTASISELPSTIEYPKINPSDIPAAPAAPIDDRDDNEEGKYIEFGAEEKDNGSATAKGKIEVNLSKSAYTYTGEQIQPVPAVTYKYYTKDANGSYSSKAKTMKLVNNVDYVLTYSDNVKASQDKPVVTVTGIGDYSGTISTKFIINKKNANKLTINPIEDIESASLTSATTEYIKSQVVVFDGVEVVDPSDYTVNVTQTTDNKGNKIADVTITPAANGNYTGDAKKAHTTLYLVSDKISISSNTISITKAENRKPFVYDGKAKKQKLIVTDTATGKKISPKNYKVVYENNINATTKDNKAYVYVIGKGDYFGKSAKFSFEIEKKDFNKVKVGKLPKITFRSNFNNIKPVIKDGKKTLKEGVDYSIGEISVKEGFSLLGVNTQKVTFKINNLSSNYSGEYKEASITVVPRKLNNAILVKVSVANGVLVSGEAKPQVVVKYAGRVLTEGTDYTLKYSGNTKAGRKGTVKITGKGNYRGCISKKFNIS